jgi:hypothetical protein
MAMGERLPKGKDEIAIKLHFDETFGSQTALARNELGDAMPSYCLRKLSEAKGGPGRDAVLYRGYGLFATNG